MPDYILQIRTDGKKRTSATTTFAACASDAEREVRAMLAPDQTIVDICLCAKSFAKARGRETISGDGLL